MSVKICGYCQARVAIAKAERVEFGLNANRAKVAIWFCSLHCVFWGGARHHRVGAATTLRSLRELFGAAVEEVK